MRRTWSRHAGRSLLSGHTTPNRKGLVVGVMASSALVRAPQFGLGPRRELIAAPSRTGATAEGSASGATDQCDELIEPDVAAGQDDADPAPGESPGVGQHGGERAGSGRLHDDLEALEQDGHGVDERPVVDEEDLVDLAAVDLE